MLLVGDIGGTKVHLAIFDNDRLVKEEKFPSRRYQTFSEILEKFLDRPIQKSCLAIAGPIQNRQCEVTNLPWKIDADELQKRHHIAQLELLNDLEAAAYGLRRLKPHDIVTLNPGLKIPGNQAVIAAGTGLGAAGLFWDGQYHHPFASEGGHVDFAPQDASDQELWNYLHKKYGHVSLDRVVSGSGLEHMYWLLVENEKRKAVLRREDIPRQIIEKGVSGESELCQKIIYWFARLYGRTAGNIALQYLAHGGVYLAGGIAPAILEVLKQGEFIRAFADKGRLKELLLQIPVHVVLNDSLTLLGALEYSKC